MLSRPPSLVEEPGSHLVFRGESPGAGAQEGRLQLPESLECAGPWGLCSLTSSWGAWEPLAFVLSWLAAALHRPCAWLLCSVAHTWARFTPHPNRTVCLSRSPEFSLTASARGPRSMPDLVLSPPLPCDAPARTCKHSCHRIDSVPNIPIKSMTVNEPLTLPIPK